MVVMASIISGVEEINGNPIEMTPELIQGATLQQWENFVNNSIKQAIELFSNVRVDEKAAYDLLP